MTILKGLPLWGYVELNVNPVYSHQAAYALVISNFRLMLL
jgi:hypothetical protein